MNNNRLCVFWGTCESAWRYGSIQASWHSFWFSLSFSEALFMKRRLIHTKVMNASDEPWSITAAPLQGPNTPHRKWLQPHGCRSLRGKKEADESHKPFVHHRTKPSLLFWFIFQKTSTAKLQRCVLPFFLSVVFVCCECVVNKTLLHGQVHSEWIGW